MKNSILENDRIRQLVRERYASVAEAEGCCSGPTQCCGDGGNSSKLGYSAEEIAVVPEGANLGLGCGNPVAIASLRAGQTVLDLGSGAGFDCFLAARAVGTSGHVIGVDMTPAMLTKARGNAAKGGYEQVEFRLGEIENLPVADGTVDVILSNCVINLSPAKARVFQEAFRVLRRGGRLAISDVVASAEIPESIRQDWANYSACISGASLVKELEGMLAAAGFVDIRIQPKDESRQFIREWLPNSRVEDYILSATIEAVKP